MTAQRVRIMIAAVLAVAVIVTIAVLYAYSSSLKPYEPILPYSERYDTTVVGINTGAGVYRERDYYVSTTNELTTPGNGELLINPVQVIDGEEETPPVQLSSYAIENNITSSVYTRITNSKRSEERSGRFPEAAVLSLEYKNTLSEGSWQSLTLYNAQSSEELVDSALIFAPSSTAHATAWENNTSLYLTDGALTDHAAALLPGINILNDFDQEGHATGVLYTNRSFAIGNLPNTAQDKVALQALEDAYASGALEDVESFRMDISQRITGTDLLFNAPESKSTVSSMQAPVSRSGATNTLSVEGGVMAVGEGATLIVGSGVVGSSHSLLGRSGSSVTDTTAGTIDLSPRAVIVDGGTLVLSDTESGKIIINADIQVRNGGTLSIGENITINGNIYVFGGGMLEVLGSFVLNGKPIALAQGVELSHAADVGTVAAQASKQVPGGMYIMANNSRQVNGTPLGTGYFYASILWMIEGSDGIDPLLKSKAIHFLSTESSPGYLLMYREYCCFVTHDTTGLCEHLGSVEGVVEPVVVLGFSEDMALVQVFATEG